MKPREETKKFPIIIFELMDKLNLRTYEEFKKFIDGLPTRAEVNESFSVASARIRFYDEYFENKSSDSHKSKKWLKKNKLSENETILLNYLKDLSKEDSINIIYYLSNKSFYPDSECLNISGIDGSLDTIYYSMKVTPNDLKTIFEALEHEGMTFDDLMILVRKIKELGFKAFIFDENLSFDNEYFFDNEKYLLSDGIREYQIPIREITVKVKDAKYIISVNTKYKNSNVLFMNSLNIDLSKLPTEEEIKNPSISNELREDLYRKREVLDNAYYRRITYNKIIDALGNFKKFIIDIDKYKDNIPDEILEIIKTPEFLGEYLKHLMSEEDKESIANVNLSYDEFEEGISKVKIRENMKGSGY